MSRPALLDKLFQAGKTLFKPALIPVDNTTIKVVDDKLAVQKATATTIGGIKISGEDGLVMKSDGSAAVDFDAMPTDKFEAMLKSIRVPIWLTGNKSFYVNQATGSDTLDSGRGESASKPFKTIQACADYVSNNYNVGSYVASIIVSAGTYEERLTLGSYSRTSGYIIIQAATDETVTISAENGNLVVIRSSSVWHIRNINLVHHFYAPNNGIANFYHIVSVGINSTANLSGCVIKAEYTGEAASSGTVTIRMLYVGASSQLNLYTKETSIEYYKGNANWLYVLFAGGKGTIEVDGSNDSSEDGEITVFGECTSFVMASGGSIFVNTSYLVDPVFTVPGDKSATGKRYEATSGGTINAGGQGTEYFPGDSAGTVEAASYSWYK